MKYLQWVIFGGLILAIVIGCASLEGTKILDAIRESVEKVSEKIQSNIVYVEITQTNSDRPMMTNGLIINNDGNILLPTHLRKDQIQKISIWIDKEEYSAKLLQSDEQHNVCLVKVKPPSSLKINPAPFEQVGSVKSGDSVVGIRSSGKDLDYQILRDTGAVLGKYEGKLDQILVTGLNVGPGTVVINFNGEIVGIGMLTRNGPTLVSVQEFKRTTNKLFAKVKNPPSPEEAKKQPWLGITWESINEDYAAAVNLPKESVLVKIVYEKSPAETAGLKSGDLIVAVDDMPLTKSGTQLKDQQFPKYIDAELNREVTFKILRNNENKIIKCRFGESPEPKKFKAEDVGIEVQNVTDLEYYGQSLAVKEGVFVTNVNPGSPAATGESMRDSLIYRGDVIIEVANMPTLNLEDFKNAINKIRQEKAEIMLVKLWRGRILTHEALNLKIGGK